MKIRNTEVKIMQADIKDNVLPKACVIHNVSLCNSVKPDEVAIRLSCKKALERAQKIKASCFALEVLGYIESGFPKTGIAKIMAQEIFRHLWFDSIDTFLKEIILIAPDKSAYNTFNKNVLSYLSYITYKIQQGPFITVDIIIEISGGIILIERSNPPYGWAIPGGFLDYNESLEACAKREAKEETSLDVHGLKQFHTYSTPGRDPRFHTVTTVFTAHAKGRPIAGSDAAGCKIFKPKQAFKLNLAFDHKQVIKDYLGQK